MVYASGAHGLAVFDCGPAGLLQVVRLPHSVDVEATMERVEVEQRRGSWAASPSGSAAVSGVRRARRQTLDALLQGKVETPLLLDGLAAAGASCSQCGWMGADASVQSCPVDGNELDRHENVADVAIASALQQDADVSVVRRRDDPADPDAGPSPEVLQLESQGGMAALLRF